MNSIKKYFTASFSFLTIFLSACNAEHQAKQQEDTQLLVGTYRELDRHIPYPFLLEKQKDSILLINNKNEVIDHAAGSSLPLKRGDTLKMQQHSFFVLKPAPQLLLVDLKDSISFPSGYFRTGILFKMPEETEAIDFEKVKALLFNKSYTSKISARPNRDLEVEKTWRFSEDSLNTVFTYFYQDNLMYSEQQDNGYQLFERGGKIFLSENGSLEDPKILYQITGITNNSIEVQYYRNNEKIRETYEVSEVQKSSAIPYYSNCLNGDPGEYYHDNITYKKGNEYLIQKFAANAPRAEGDGYITVHFNINCDGKVGRLGLEQMDRDYKSTSFNLPLIKYVLNEVTQLRDWPEVKPYLFFKDVHAFLMFKIEDGKIIDLCP